MKKSVLFTTALLLTSLFLLPNISSAQNGSLDLSFGTGGKVVTDTGSNDVCRSVAIQSDGKILIAGTTKVGLNTDFALIRYQTNGLLDNTFGNGGIMITDINGNDNAWSLAVQPDGKIVVAGSSIGIDGAVVRYNTNGSLDSSFGPGGKVTFDIAGTGGYWSSVAIQSDGKIVLAGFIDNGSNFDIALLRCNTNGTLDSTFANAGVQITDNGGTHEFATDVALQNDGKIVISAYHGMVGGNGHMMVARYNTSGFLDSTFGNNGMVATVVGISEAANSVAIQSDGKIVMGGYVTVNLPSNERDLMLVRYQTNGTLDNTFGNGGIAVTAADSSEWGYSLAIQADGRIILGGHIDIGNSKDFILACYNTDGTLYNTFGNAGMVQTDISGNDLGFSLALQNDGKIVMVGNANNGSGNDFILARYIYEYPDEVSNISNEHKLFYCYPNPFSRQTTFKITATLHDATLLVFNTFGQKVKQLNHLLGNEIKLYRDYLPTGFYAVQLIQENKTIARGSMLVQD